MPEIIRLLKSTASSDYSTDFVSKVFNNIGQLGAIVSVYWPPLKFGQFPNLVVRATAYNSRVEIVTNIVRLKYPPLQFNTNYQRASTPDNPMFYCTLNKGPDFKDLKPQLATCFHETFSDYNKLLSTNDSICFSLWYIKRPLRLLTVFKVNEFNNDLDAYIEIRNAYHQGTENLDDDLKANTNEFNEFLADRFSIPVDGNIDDYKPSGLITQHMLQALIRKNMEIDGIIFKSTRSPNSDFNLAILPDSCDSKLECLKVIDCKLLPNQVAKGNSQFLVDKKSGDLIDKQELNWFLKL